MKANSSCHSLAPEEHGFAIVHGLRWTFPILQFLVKLETLGMESSAYILVAHETGLWNPPGFAIYHATGLQHKLSSCFLCGPLVLVSR